MKTHIVSPNQEWLERAKEHILQGGVVAFHTETVYGLGANAFNDEAVKSIFALKGRPADNPLIAHVHRDYDISKIVDEVPAYTEKLRKAFLPGPLTMVYPSKGKVSRYVSCGLDTLAIRVPSSLAAQAFLREVDLPIAAPSANRSKHVSPVTAQHVYDDFEGKIPLILDGGACDGGIESTVLDCTGEIPVILRAGLVTREMIKSVVGACGVYEKKAGERPKSPGMAYKHYAPKCKTAYFTAEEIGQAIVCYREEEEKGGRPYFFLESGFAKELTKKGFRVFDLGETGEQMAQRLYAALRQAETQATLLIAIEPSVRGGVMDGVMNRLTRAFGRTNDET
ncbi:MAG: threonylcarbamoyl-AMP synthase [Clostridia bacterium]|nr:threonylcarbamoyl-AMP synthase [Clostridia bacterium]